MFLRILYNLQVFLDIKLCEVRTKVAFHFNYILFDTLKVNIEFLKNYCQYVDLV